jgi:hypothetical protein
MENKRESLAPREKKYASTTLLKPMRAFFTRRKIWLPKRIPLHILAHARRIILGLEKGRSYTVFKGKRLFPDREVISIPVGRHWRLLAVWQDGKVIPVRLLSHEAYNHKWKWEKR